MKKIVAPVEDLRLFTLERRLLATSLVNLFLTACLGVLLRSYPFIEGLPFTYKNVLHGHSHFAFGGWIMPACLLLLMKFFPEIRNSIAYRHWKNIALLLLFSAYGMLLSFPFQGYKPFSIFFSTLSVAASYYLLFVTWPLLKGRTASQRFLKAGLLYLAVSVIGPFATGPLIAMGKQGSPVYYNAVYFYLHFQINGWFTFFVLALLYRWMELRGLRNTNPKSFKPFHFACMPAYLLSVLWNSPGLLFNIVGATAALLQLLALLYLLSDLKRFEQPALLKLALAAFVLKLVLQLGSAVPFIAQMGYEHRNLIIAYLHLTLLGSITLFLFHFLSEGFALGGRSMRAGLVLFLFSLVSTELLLLLYALGGMFGFAFPGYNQMMLAFSLLFPAGILLITLSAQRASRKKAQLNETLFIPGQFNRTFFPRNNDHHR